MLTDLGDNTLSAALLGTFVGAAMMIGLVSFRSWALRRGERQFAEMFNFNPRPHEPAMQQCVDEKLCMLQCEPVLRSQLHEALCLAQEFGYLQSDYWEGVLNELDAKSAGWPHGGIALR